MNRYFSFKQRILFVVLPVIFGCFLFFDFVLTATVVCDTTSALTIPGASNPYSMNFNCAVPSDATASLELKFTVVNDRDGRDYFRCGGSTLFTTSNIPSPLPTTMTEDVSSCLRGYNLTTGSRIYTGNAWSGAGGYYYGSADGHSTMEYARLTVTYDDGPPEILSSHPSDNSTTFNMEDDLVIYFDRATYVGTGNITIKKTSDNSTIETIDVTGDQVTGGGSPTITIDPSTELVTSTAYYIQIDNTAFNDNNGNNYAGIDDTTTWNFTTLNIIPPTDQAHSLSFSSVTTSSLTLSWSGGNGDGSMVFVKQSNTTTANPVGYTNYTANASFGSGDQIGETGWYAVYSGSGSSVNITNLSEDTDYIFQVIEYNTISNAKNYFIDTATNNPVASSIQTEVYDTTSSLTIPGAQNPYSMNFGCAVPSGSSASLEIKWTSIGDRDGRDYFKCGSTILYTTSVLTGTYPIITIKDISSCVAGENLSSGSLIHTNNAWNTGGYYYGSADGHSTMEYARLTVVYAEGPPNVASFSPTDGNTIVDADANFVLNFDRPTYAGTGNITIKKASDNSIVEAIDVTSGQVTGTSTAIITINPSVTLDSDTAYYIQIDTTAFNDGNGNYYSGIDDTTTWNFTTIDTTPPTEQATNIVFSSVDAESMTVGWTNGDGDGRIVFAKQASTGTTTPVDATNYSANATFGSGTQIGSTGWYTVYKGTGTSVSVTNLTPNTDYIFQVFEYDLGGSDPIFLIDTDTNNPNTQTTDNVPEPETQASGLSFSSVAYTSMTVSWDDGDGENRVVFAKQASTGTTEPIDDTNYSANANFGSGTQIGSTGWYAVYNGSGSSVNVTGLMAETDYIFQVFEYNSSGGVYNYKTSTSTNNPNTQVMQTVIAPTTQASSTAFSSVSNSSFTVSWASGNGTGRAVFVKEASSGTATPVDDTVYTANTAFGSGTQIGETGWYCVYKDSGSSVTVTGLSTLTTYIVQVFEYNASGSDIKFLTDIDTDNPNTQTTSEAPEGEDFETGDFSANGWSFGGTATNYEWTVTSDEKNGGTYSAKAGAYNENSRTSYMEITLDVAEAGNISYYRKVSSESNYDYFRFYIDGVQKESRSGSYSWGQSTYAVDSGSHTFKWQYSKDGSVSSGSDTVWIDDITFPEVAVSSYSFEYTAGDNGSLEGETSQTVEPDANGAAVTAVPDEGYHFVNWSDGSTDNPRTDTGASEDISVTANFMADNFSLTYTAGDNGSITGSSTQIVSAESDGSAVTAVPDEGYHFVNWSDSSTDNPRTDTSVTTTISVTANFSPNSFTLTYTAGDNGSVSGSSTQIVGYTEDGTAITAVPDEGYYFIAWSDGSTDNPRTDTNVSDDISVSAIFSTSDPSIIYANSTTGSDSIGNGSAENPYKTFYKAYTECDDLCVALDLNGTFTWTDSDELGDAIITGYTLDKSLILQGHGPDTTIIQAAEGDNLATSRVFTISAGITITLQDLAIRYGKVYGYGNDGGGIRNSGTLTLNNCEVYNNRTLGDGGGGISNRHTLTVASSTIYNNTAYYMGGGLLNHYYIDDDGYMTVTNSTIAHNQQLITVAYTEGGGIHFRKGSGTITNSTIAFNTARGVAGVGIDDPDGTITIKNSIIAKNIRRGYSWGIDFGYRQSGYGNVVDNGNNIIGYSQNYSFTEDNDWIGASSWSELLRWDGEDFTLYSSSTSGNLALDSALGINNNDSKTQTLRLLADSIAIDNGETGTNGDVSVPTTDQRGTERNGDTDIGAFEFTSAPEDATAPTISEVSASASTSSATITWSTDEESTSQVKYDANTAKSTFTSIYNTNTKVTEHEVSLTGLVACSKYYYTAISKDAAENWSESDESYFYTTGCAGNASISDITEASANPEEDTDISQTSGGLTMQIRVPTSTAETQTDFQVKSLPAITVLSALSRPSNYNGIGSSVFDIKALRDPASYVSSFDDAVTVTVSYSDSEISGLEESSLLVHRHDGSSWNALSNCVVDTSANTVTCDTNNFSVFGLFGQTASTQENSSSGGASFTPPSTPVIKTEPKVENGSVVFEVENTKQIAVSETEDFSKVSWQDYDGEYINDTGKPMYIKFRSEDGGVSQVFVINSVNEDVCSVCDYEGKLIKYLDSSKVYLVENNKKRWITNEEAFNYFGYGWTEIKVVADNFEFINGENIVKPVVQTAGFVFDRNLELGASGEDVRRLQIYLNNNGFKVDTVGYGAPGQETQYFGKLTKQALIKFQQANNLPAYGYFGPMTRALLK